MLSFSQALCRLCSHQNVLKQRGNVMPWCACVIDSSNHSQIPYFSFTSQENKKLVANASSWSRTIFKFLEGRFGSHHVTAKRNPGDSPNYPAHYETLFSQKEPPQMLLRLRMDPSHDTAIKGSKRGQEGIKNEAIFQFRYLFSQIQSFINIFWSNGQNMQSRKDLFLVTVTAWQSWNLLIKVDNPPVPFLE